MSRLPCEVIQSRLNCTNELLDGLAKLANETLRQIDRTGVPLEIPSKYWGARREHAHSGTRRREACRIRIHEHP